MIKITVTFKYTYLFTVMQHSWFYVIVKAFVQNFFEITDKGVNTVEITLCVPV